MHTAHCYIVWREYLLLQDTLVQVRAVVVPGDGGDPEAERGEGQAGGGAHEAAGEQRGHGGGAEGALPAAAGVAGHREGVLSSGLSTLDGIYI